MATHVKIGSETFVGAHITSWNTHASYGFLLWMTDGEETHFRGQSEEFAKELEAALLDVTGPKKDMGFGMASNVIEIKTYDPDKDVYDDE